MTTLDNIKRRSETNAKAHGYFLNPDSESSIIQDTVDKFSTKALNNLDQGKIDAFDLLSDLLYNW